MMTAAVGLTVEFNTNKVPIVNNPLSSPLDSSPRSNPVAKSDSPLVMPLNLFSRSANNPSRNEQHDPHRGLSDLLNSSHLQHGARWSNNVRASILRQLWQTVWQDPHWIQYFVPEGTQVPVYDNIWEWLVDTPNGPSTPWTLSAKQAQIEEQRKAEGKQRIWIPRQGQICGKVMQRHDRTYTCKYVLY